MGSSELLPEDVLADILRRLAPRWLATSRRVCRAWRATVDNRGLLSAVADLFPRSVAGIFIESNMGSFLLARPSAGPVISAYLDYTFSSGNGDEIDDCFEFRDHCNGLLLLNKNRVVVNPATQQWAHLPPHPPLPCVGSPDYFYTDDYLAYDPADSPHYEVFSIPRIRRHYELEPRHRREGQILSPEGSPITLKDLDPALEELEWPPSPLILRVFSSRTGRWEQRSFVREGVAAGAAAGTIARMRIDPYVGHRYAVYWRGALYVQCQTDFIMRLSLSSEKYQLIQPPVTFEPPEHGFVDESYDTRLSIGKSEKGVYSVLVRQSQIKVWILDDSDDGQIKWVSKQLVAAALPKLQDERYYKLESHGSWMLQDAYHSRFDTRVNPVTEPFEWDSDDDDLLPDNGNRTGYKYFITFMGFHPYKEVIFLNDSFVRVLAFHLNSSKIQDLGYVYPEKEDHYLGNDRVFVERAFPYTPCWMRDFPSKCLI